MKRLINIPNYIKIIIGVTFVVAISFTVFLLTHKVETTIHTKVKTLGTTHSIFVNSDIAYRIKESDYIHLRIGGKIHTAYIQEIIYDKDSKLYQIKLSGLSINLLPNSIIDATIVNGIRSIGSFLFHGV